MPKFALKHIKTKKGRMCFKQLVILNDQENAEKIQAEIIEAEETNTHIDEKKLTAEKRNIRDGVMDIYEDFIEHSDKSSLLGIFALMDLVVDLQKLPKTQFRPLQPKSKDGDFELKRGNLRIYGIDIEGGKLIIKCGHKNTQDEDISHFRSLKEQYLESLKLKKLENGKRRINQK